VNVQTGWEVRLSMRAVALAMAVFALMGLSFAGRAAADSIASGATQIELNRGLFKALKKDGVRVTKVGLGSVKGRTLTAPVSGGLIDFATASGWIDSTGGLRFRAGKRSVKLTQVTLDTSKGTLRAILAGQKMEIAAVEKYEFSRVEWGDAVELSGLRLKRRVSNLLNRKLGLDTFRPNRAFASVSSTFQPAELQVSGGSFRFDFDAGTVAKIRSLGVELTPISSTSSGSEPPVFSNSLMTGRIDPVMARTWGMAEGGFRIASPESPGPSADWWNLGISFETGKLGAMGLAHTEMGQLAPAPPSPVASVDLSSATVSVDPHSRTVTISNARATLEAGTADYINRTFAEPKGKAPVLAAGDPLGTVSMTMQGR
jgi:hypothetical protein